MECHWLLLLLALVGWKLAGMHAGRRPVVGFAASSGCTPPLILLTAVLRRPQHALPCRFMCAVCCCPADAEAEESGIRPRTLSDSDEDDEEPGASTPSRSRSGPPVVAAAMTEAAPAPAPAQSETAAGQAPVGRFEAAGLKSKGLLVDNATTAAQDTVAAAVGRFEAAGLRSKQQPDSAAQPETAATAEPEQAQQQEVVAHAAQETEANLESMSKEVGHLRLPLTQHASRLPLPFRAQTSQADDGNFCTGAGASKQGQAAPGFSALAYNSTLAFDRRRRQHCW